MKKIPLHTIIFFYLSIVPVVLFLIWGCWCVIFGNLNEIFGAIIWICGPALIFLLPVILFLQVAEFVSYSDARKKVREHKENHTDDEDYQSIL